jgi:hypothetical protein
MRYVILCIAFLVSGCQTVDGAVDDFYNWADRTMPKYEDNEPKSGEPEVGEPKNIID